MVQARAAYDFVDMIGVNLHLGYQSVTYEDYQGLVKPALLDLGIKNVRDGWTGSYTPLVDKLKDLGASGIKVCLLPNWAYGQQLPHQVKQMAIDIGVNNVVAIEGHNEPDQGNKAIYDYEGLTYHQATLRYQEQLYAAVKNDSVTRHIPVISPSFDPANMESKKDGLDATLYKNVVDGLNHHPYSGSRQVLETTTGYMPTHHQVNILKGFWGDKPLYATEQGIAEIGTLPDNYWHNGRASNRYVGVAALRILFFHFQLNYKKLYYYQLVDNDGGESHGLMRLDRSKRLSYDAVKNAISILKDASRPSTLGDLGCTIQGQTPDTRTVVLQKSNGNFYFISWNAIPAYNFDTDQDILTPAPTVTYVFDRKFKEINLYEPLWKREVWKQALNTDRISHYLLEHPTIIELVPEAPVAPPPPAPSTMPGIAVNCGASVDYTDPSGLVWKADIRRTGGQVATTNIAATMTHKPGLFKEGVFGSSDFNVTSGDGVVNYPFPVSEMGNARHYAIDVYYQEDNYTAAGQRLFNVEINGVRVETEFDIFAQTKAQGVALLRTYQVDLPSTVTTLNVKFLRGTKDNCYVKAIWVRPR